MGPGKGRLRIVRNVPIELLVLLLRHFRLVACPESTGLVDRRILPGEQDRQADVVRILADGGLDLPGLEQVVLPLAQVHDDLRAALRPGNRLKGVFPAAIGLPPHRGFGRQARATRREGYLVRNDEGRIEPDAELPDQVGILLLVAGQPIQELARPGPGDRADIGYYLVAGHPDPVVGNGDGASILVHRDPDLQVRVGFVQRIVGQRFKAKLVCSVRGVGYQLPQEDLLVAVQRVDHQLQELLHLGLESQRLPGPVVPGCGLRHRDCPSVVGTDELVPSEFGAANGDFKGFTR